MTQLFLRSSAAGNKLTRAGVSGGVDIADCANIRAMSFPQRFDLNSFRGPRAGELRHPEAQPGDLFQKLVTDALVEDAGEDAFAIIGGPTAGKDAGVDVWCPRGVFGCQGPTVVQIRFHGSTTSYESIRDSVYGERRKLKGWNQDNWQGTPSRSQWTDAAAYVYCVSCSLQPTENRALANLFREFFCCESSLDIVANDIRVVDWEQLRPWLDRMPRMIDAWLGIPDRGITGHEEYSRNLRNRGFNEFLLEDKLPYVPPESSDPLHPTTVLRRLWEIKDSDEPGILIVGPGGVGKTRLGVEVAKQAHAAGWRAIHCEAKSRGLQFDNLERQVLASNEDTPTLIVFDYIDQLRPEQFGLGDIRLDLMPEARARAIPLAFLANCRPGWDGLDGDETKALFQFERLELEKSRQSQITRAGLPWVAPSACDELGLEKLHDFCGDRPIIAFFLAARIESFSVGDREAQLRELRLRDHGFGKLRSWMLRGLREAGLRAQPTAAPGVDLEEPLEGEIAAAAALAAAPHSKNRLIQVAESAGAPNARAIIDEVLVPHGWLEGAFFVTTPHDVVVDEVVSGIVRLGRDNIRVEPLRAFLTAGLAFPSTLERFVNVLSRMRQGGGFADALQTEVGKWFASEAETVKGTFSEHDDGEACFALASLLRISPWGETSELAEIAMDWLKDHSDHLGASFVLAPLLESADTSDRTPEPGLVRFALAWLEHHSLLRPATFILGPLLKVVVDLDRLRSSIAVQFALDWLHEHGERREASFVMAPLLDVIWKTDSQKEPEALRLSVQWLEVYKNLPEARWVLRPVLKFDCKATPSAPEIAIQWLRKHRKDVDARYVLEPLLSRQDLENEQAAEARGQAFAWLDYHRNIVGASRVLKPLATHYIDSGLDSDKIARLCREWLKCYGGRPEASHVLDPLLRLAKDSDTEHEQLVQFSRQWLRDHWRTRDASWVLEPLLDLLEQEDLSTSEVIQYSYKWLDHHGELAQARWVLRPLLEIDSEPATLRVIELSLAWLAKHVQLDDARFVLEPLLKRTDLGHQEKQATLCALDWVGAHLGDPNARRVLGPMLMSPTLCKLKRARYRAACLSLQWVGRQLEFLDASYVLEPLLTEQSELQGWVDDMRRKALEWLRVHHQDHAPTNNVQRVLKALLSLEDLADDHDEIIEVSLEWLKRVGPSTRASFVLPPLLERDDLRSALAQAAVDHAIECVETVEPPDASHVLEPLLLRNDLGPAESRALELGIEWLDQVPDLRKKAWVLPGVLQRIATADEQHPERHRYALEGTDLIEKLMDNANGEAAKRASKLLGPLLPLAACLGDQALLSRVESLARRVLRRLCEVDRKTFAKTSSELITQGAWPDSALGRRKLQSLGVSLSEVNE